MYKVDMSANPVPKCEICTTIFTFMRSQFFMLAFDLREQQEYDQNNDHVINDVRYQMNVSSLVSVIVLWSSAIAYMLVQVAPKGITRRTMRATVVASWMHSSPVVFDFCFCGKIVTALRASKSSTQVVTCKGSLQRRMRAGSAKKGVSWTSSSSRSWFGFSAKSNSRQQRIIISSRRKISRCFVRMRRAARSWTV